MDDNEAVSFISFISPFLFFEIVFNIAFTNLVVCDFLEGRHNDTKKL